MTYRYVALLRGINVGGHTKVEMGKLRQLFANLGYTNIKTLLNSGNVVFDARETTVEKLTQTIIKHLEKKLGFPIHTIVRSVERLKQLGAASPFKRIKVTPETRLYVTFISGPVKSGLKIPFTSPDNDVHILSLADGMVCSVIQLSARKGTVDLMAFLEKEFGKQVTTRNWNTVQKIAAE